MSRTTKIKRSSKSGSVAVSKSASASTGRVVWHVVQRDGKQKTVVTSKTSNAAIKDGAAIYGEALKSLAKR